MSGRLASMEVNTSSSEKRGGKSRHLAVHFLFHKLSQEKALLAVRGHGRFQHICVYTL
jgi:hypothetical protein